MSKLSYETMIDGLRHEDLFVRSGALLFLAESGEECRVDASLAVFDILEKHGWEGAFTTLGYIAALPIDEEVSNRLISCLANRESGSSLPVWEKNWFETFYDWFAKAPPSVCRAGLDEINAIASGLLFEQGALDAARFNASLLDCDSEKCRAMLNDHIKECEEESEPLDEAVFEIQSIVKQLSRLNKIDAGEVASWINEDARFEDEDALSVEDIKVCIGFEMAKAASIAVPLKRCLECLDHQFDWLSDAVVETMIATADEALLDELIKRYPRTEASLKEEFLLVFEKVRFPGREEKIRDLATLEKNSGLRSQFGIILSFFGTDRGLKYSREILEGMDDEIEGADIIDVLYALRVLRGESSPELEEWREMLEEIHIVTQKMISGELDFPQFSEGLDSYDPLVPPDPDMWLGMDEYEQIALVREFCEGYEGGIEGIDSHVSIHVVVENQIAQNDDDLPARATLERLIEDGLNRHEAIHAIGYVAIGQIFDIQKKNKEYNVKAHARELKELKALDWQGSADREPRSGFSSGETYSGESPKINRNDPCPCGSGKKFKKCCIKNAN